MALSAAMRPKMADIVIFGRIGAEDDDIRHCVAAQAVAAVNAAADLAGREQAGDRLAFTRKPWRY